LRKAHSYVPVKTQLPKDGEKLDTSGSIEGGQKSEEDVHDENRNDIKGSNTPYLQKKSNFRSSALSTANYPLKRKGDHIDMLF